MNTLSAEDKKRYSEKAAKWWADQLKGCKQDTGDKKINDFIASHVSSFSIKEKEKIDIFQEELEKLISSKLVDWDIEETNVGSANRCLACDYHPEGILREAASKAGIMEFCPPFPCKTVMWINPDGIYISNGYAAEIIKLDISKDNNENK